MCWHIPAQRPVLANNSARQAVEPYMKPSLLLLLWSCPALIHAATPPYPTRPIRWIVTFPAGGGTDIIARTLSPRLAERLGQSVVVDNRGGAAGVIGAELAARAAPDGHTMLFGTSSSLVLNPMVMKGLPYDAARDFAPVTLLVTIPQLLVVNPAVVPAQTVKELIALARSAPGKLNYASAGIAAPNHVATELLNTMTGIQMNHVPYKGAAPGIADLLGGQVQLMFNPMPALVPHVRSGKLRALGIGSRERSMALPEVPTVAESGVPGYEYVLWYGLFVPTRTPRDIVARLNAEVTALLNDPDIARRFAAQGAEPRPMTPAAFSQFIRDETARLSKVVKAANIRLE